MQSKITMTGNYYVFTFNVQSKINVFLYVINLKKHKKLLNNFEVFSQNGVFYITVYWFDREYLFFSEIDNF